MGDANSDPSLAQLEEVMISFAKMLLWTDCSPKMEQIIKSAKDIDGRADKSLLHSCDAIYDAKSDWFAKVRQLQQDLQSPEEKIQTAHCKLSG